MFGRMEACGRLTLACLAALVLALVGIAGMAQAQQTWHFDAQDHSEDVCPNSQCSEMGRQGSPAQDNTTIGAGDTHYWIAQESVAVDSVDFGSEAWTLHIQCTNGALVSGTTQIEFRIGFVDSDGFTEFTGASNGVGCSGGALDEATQASLNLNPNDDAIIAQDQHLALEVQNIDSEDVFISVGESDGGTDFTTLVSPEDDPGYPVWETTSFVLLGAGIIGVLGYTRFRG